MVRNYKSEKSYLYEKKNLFRNIVYYLSERMLEQWMGFIWYYGYCIFVFLDCNLHQSLAVILAFLLKRILHFFS